MDENIELDTLYRKVINLSWVVLICISVILGMLSLIFFPNILWYKLSLSYLLGAMTSIFAFNLLKNNVSNLSSNARRAISGSSSNYAIRFVIYAFVLFFSFKFENEKLSPYLVALGFLTVKVGIYLNALLKKK
ncbi:MAG: hypothetical protein K0Q49_700 [Haloplasmataceae bacterium]|jgi:hypothetical protein|nr:hypothetical protein [Haloplasmataceae bacterium]